MPLTERDINTERDVPRNQRYSIQPDLAYTRLKDENSPSLRGASSKTTPLSQRLLAPTKASAAKATTATQRAARSTTPQPRISSKLPRRTTPNTAPPTSDQDTSAADQTTPTARSTFAASEIREQKAGTVTISCRQTDPRQSHSRPSMYTAQPGEKPLPPRPIASLDTMSPTKDSRTLLDASEKPLQLSQHGELGGWAVMMPNSAIDPAPERSSADKADPTRLVPSSTISPDSIFSPDRWATGVPNSLVDTSLSTHGHDTTEQEISERSSSAKFGSAKDGNVRRATSKEGTSGGNFGSDDTMIGQYLTDHEYTTSQYPDDSSFTEYCQTEYPSRDAPLQAQHHLGFADTSTVEQQCPLAGFTDLLQSTTSSTADSRPHSPSPASFSRPRPSSISHARSLPSPNTTAANAAKVLRAQKTASRIPIPDTKKATLVDVKTGTSAATQKSEHGPSFGSRRLEAPDTLKILDQGVKRRQLNQPKRIDTGHSTATTTTTSTQTYGQNECPHMDSSRTSTPDDTFGTSSSDEEEIATPTYQPDISQRPDLLDKPFDEHSNSFYHSAAVRLFDGAVSALGRTPPPTSPYTEPLQTIPSQALLPTYTDKDALPVPIHSRQPSDITTLNKRLSSLYSAHADHTAALVGDRAMAPESTKYSLLELLNEYTNEDGHLSKDGQSALDPETRKHITRTLWVLEGKGSPPHHEVDNETLLRLFGHLKRGLERQPKSVSFVNNAAAAEKFLAQANDGGTQVHDTESNISRTQFDEPVTGDKPDVPDTKAHLPPIEAVASKWSESTASVQALSPISSEVSPRQPESSRKADQLSGRPKRLPLDPPRSIGYPSRIPSKANALIGPGESGAATPPEPFQRLSSPTLGKRKPGSVRAARETLHQVKGGFARTTASAESKKSFKMPTPNTRPLKLPESGQRGRVPSAEKPRSHSDGAVAPNTPRARSKSRYVLDKINGLFSAKRDKRGSAMPPVPAIAVLDDTTDRSIEVTASSSPVPRPARDPPLTKMPTMSPTIEHPALRSISRADTSTSADSPVDSMTTGDDGQALQSWATSLVSKAARERDPVRKERLMNFAKVLNNSLISAREAQISAETAQHAARSAQLSYEMTQKSVAMLQRLAVSLTARGARR